MDRKTQREIVGADGKRRIYTFVPLTVEAAADIEDDLVRILARFSRDAGGAVSALFLEASSESQGAALVAAVPAAVLEALPKAALKSLSKSLLAGCIVDEPGGTIHELTDGWADEYMRGRWLERIDALIEAIDVSFPGYFSKARAHLVGFAKRRLSRITSPAKSTGSPEG